MVKNTLPPPPPNNATVYKYGSENIHVCSALLLWVYFDSSFNKIQVIPPFQHSMCSHYMHCVLQTLREKPYGDGLADKSKRKLHLQ